MFFYDPFNPNGRINQEDIWKSPDEREEESCELHEQIVKVILSPAELAQMGGKLPNSRVLYFNKNGIPVKETQILCRFDSLGRIVGADDVAGISWTGEAVPYDSATCCINPWELHAIRIVYLNRDGFITELGNVLCTECFERLKNMITKFDRWLVAMLGVDAVQE